MGRVRAGLVRGAGGLPLTILAWVFAASAVRAEDAGTVAPPSRETTRESLSRGPIESRDEWLLAQGLLTMPAVSPDTVPDRHTELRFDGDWGSDFGWRAGRGGQATDLQYLVDGEHRSGAITVRRGFGRFALGARVALLWRGPGLMDGIIDRFHQAFDLPDSGRSLFPDDRLRVEGRDRARTPLAWSGRSGTGLGNVELEARRSLIGDPEGGWRVAVDGRVSVPSATGPFGGAGAAAGVQLVAARSLGSRAQAYAGTGLSVRSRREFEGLAYRALRPQAFLTFEGRVTRWWSQVVQIDAAGPLVTNVDAYPGDIAYMRVVTRMGIGRWTIEGGFTEGIVNQDASTDFGLLLGLRRRF